MSSGRPPLLCPYKVMEFFQEQLMEMPSFEHHGPNTSALLRRPDLELVVRDGKLR